MGKRDFLNHETVGAARRPSAQEIGFRNNQEVVRRYKVWYKFILLVHEATEIGVLYGIELIDVIGFIYKLNSGFQLIYPMLTCIIYWQLKLVVNTLPFDLVKVHNMCTFIQFDLVLLAC